MSPTKILTVNCRRDVADKELTSDEVSVVSLTKNVSEVNAEAERQITHNEVSVELMQPSKNSQ